MRNWWWKTFRRLAAGCILRCRRSARHTALCYAAVANDNASDPVYASGWENGQTGGFGFTGWNFESGYFWPYFKGGNNTFFPYDQRIHTIDDGQQAGSQFSNPFNNVGRAWAGATFHYADGPNGPKLSLPRGGRGLTDRVPQWP